MADGYSVPKIHLRVTVVPPTNLDEIPAAPTSFILNLEPDVTFYTAWDLIQSRYAQNYVRPKDWSFKKIQDAYGADISLGDTVGDMFAGESREKCVVNVLQIQSHREDTIPGDSSLQPRHFKRDPDASLQQSAQSLSPVISIPDMALEDPIEDDSAPTVRERRPVTPQQALDNLKRRRLSRSENPDTKEPPGKPAEPRRLIYRVWSEDDDRLFVRALQEGQDYTTLHSRRFPLRTLEAVKHHFAEMRRKLEIDHAVKHRETRVAELTSLGYTPSKTGETWQEHEDDLLLAARLFRVEIKRVAKDHFPLRTLDQVTARAKHVYNKASRKALRRASQPASQVSQASQYSIASPTPGAREPSIEHIFATFDTDLRDRIDKQRLRIREDVRKFTTDRERESRLSQRISRDKESTRKFKERTRKSTEFLSLLEQEKTKDDDIKARRLAEDVKNNQLYSAEYAAWYAQKVADEAAGRPTAPSPKRPLGSRIGTEIATSQPTSNKSAYPSPTRTSSVSNEPLGERIRTRAVSKQLQENAAPASRKRGHSIVVEVRISPPPAKKQKPAAAAAAAPPASTAPPIKNASLLQDTPSKKQKLTALPASNTRDTLKVPPLFQQTHPSRQPKTAESRIPQVSGFPFKMHGASMRGDRERYDAAQAASRQALPMAGRPSSPLQAKDSGSRLSIKKTRQTTLPFAKPPSKTIGKRPAARATSDLLVSSASRKKVPDSELLSSDDSSSYSDSDINDEDLTELADRSSEVFQSSPPHAPTAIPHAARVQSMKPASAVHHDVAASNVRSSPRGKGKAPAKASLRQDLTGDTAAFSAKRTPTATGKSRGNDSQAPGASTSTPIVIADDSEDAIVIPDDAEHFIVKPEPNATPSRKKSTPSKHTSKLRSSNLLEQEVEQTGSQQATLAAECRGTPKSISRVSSILDGVRTGLTKMTGMPDGDVEESTASDSESESPLSIRANGDELRIPHSGNIVPESRRQSIQTEELTRDAPTSAQKPRRVLSDAPTSSGGDNNVAEAIQRSLFVNTGNVQLSGQPSTALYESDVEEIDPSQLLRLPRSPMPFDSEEDMMDHDDAQAYAEARGQYFQGEKPGAQFRYRGVSPSVEGRLPPLVESRLKYNYRAASPLVPVGKPGAKYVYRADSPPVFSSQVGEAFNTSQQRFDGPSAFGTPSGLWGNGMTGRRNFGVHEPATQDLAPPFPSSGQTRASLRTTQSQHLLPSHSGSAAATNSAPPAAADTSSSSTLR